MLNHYTIIKDKYHSGDLWRTMFTYHHVSFYRCMIMQQSATCLWWNQVYPVRLMMAGIVQATVKTTTSTGH
ncbi:hypothetical protein K492DRAFT_174532 [Lichtheimia hyalospora FSU 10163]|nr:hypothetical protein K492DRAFT_174532 [Lichtheimia hyalospora FSU 10163]